MSAKAAGPASKFSSQNSGKRVTSRAEDVGNVTLLLEGARALVTSCMEGGATGPQAISMIEPTATLAPPRFNVAPAVFPAGGGTAQQQAYHLAMYAYDKDNRTRFTDAQEAVKVYILEALDESASAKCFPARDHLTMTAYQLLDAITTTLRVAHLSCDANTKLLEILEKKIVPSDELSIWVQKQKDMHGHLHAGGRGLNNGHKLEILVKTLSPEPKLVALLALARGAVPGAQADDFTVVTTEFIRQSELQDRLALRSAGSAHATEETHEANATTVATAQRNGQGGRGGRGGRGNGGGRGGRDSGGRGGGARRGGDNGGGKAAPLPLTVLTEARRAQIQQIIDAGGLVKYCYWHGYHYLGHTSAQCRACGTSFPADKAAATASNKMGGSVELNNTFDQVAKHVFNWY